MLDTLGAPGSLAFVLCGYEQGRWRKGEANKPAGGGGGGEAWALCYCLNFSY